MACIVGMTTNLIRRKSERENEYPTLRNWKEFGPYPTREQAQEKEKQLAKQYRCHSNPGGRDNPGARWWVYKFDY